MGRVPSVGRLGRRSEVGSEHANLLRHVGERVERRAQEHKHVAEPGVGPRDVAVVGG